MLSELEGSVRETLKEFAETDLKDTSKLMREVWKLGDSYEAHLLRALESPDVMREGKIQDPLTECRSRFELARFDMVQYFNQVDARKKLRIVQGVIAMTGAVGEFFEGGTAMTEGEAAVVSGRKQALQLAEANFRADTDLWRVVRSRLEAELQGERAG
jgi:hypothetical protein